MGRQVHGLSQGATMADAINTPQAGAASRAAIFTPAELLVQLDAWIGACRPADGAKWRSAIAGTLVEHGHGLRLPGAVCASLTLDTVDELTKKTHQLSGLVALMGLTGAQTLASFNGGVQDSLMWLARDLAAQVDGLAQSLAGDADAFAMKSGGHLAQAFAQPLEH
jgi:hypothetical protein